STLSTCLKVQLQITGAEQVPSSYIATLHHQLIYKLQNRALDRSILGHTPDTLLITAERENEILTIVQIPKQLPRDEITKLMPLEWFTNYEKLHQNHKPIHTADPNFIRFQDGQVKTVFKLPDESSSTTPSMMIRLVTSEEEIHIAYFSTDGSKIFTNKINGHFVWDTDPSMCDLDCDYWMDLEDEEDDRPSSRRRKNKGVCTPQPHTTRRQYHPDDPDSPWVFKKSPENSSAPKTAPCMMFSSYDQDSQLLKDI
ncbi:uncharacterized protein LOC112095161, partial [Morus notabilis]